MEFKLTLPETTPEMTVLDLLEKEWLVPRKVRHFLRMRKNLTVNGELAQFSDLVHAHDVIQFTIEESDYHHQEIQPGRADLVDVLFEDDQLIIVNKPVGMKTHPNEIHENNTLLNHVAAYLAPQGVAPAVVHRLDTDTSGAILFAKNPFVLPILSQMLEEKQIYRKYQAQVSGNIAHDTVIRKKIGRDRHDRHKQVVDEHGGKTAVTHVTVVNHNPQRSDIYCVLETGRTHQIRVHLESIGHPVIGDTLYGKRRANRLMLHAYEMHLTHPFTKQELIIKAEPGLF
jgi:23S rRNA pseudouridine1911/1915/1917 synthase